MTKIKNYIGIDISKEWLDVAVLSEENRKPFFEERVSNNVKDLRRLKTKLLSHHVPLNKSSIIVCENTGIYKKPLVDFCLKQRCLLSVQTSQQIKKSLGIQRGKNDKIDARRIAEYAITNQHKLTVWKNPRKEIGKLKDLLRNRERVLQAKWQLEKVLKEFGTFYTSGNFKLFKRLNKPATSGIKDSLTDIDNEIKLLAENDLNINKQWKLLKSVPGIGTITALALICYTNEFSFCKTGKQLACYVGVAPFEHSSGSSVKGKTRVSHIANKKLKSLFHMGALSVMRMKKGELVRYYNRKVKEGKNKMSILNAIKNKIILRAVAVIKRGTPYITKTNT
jgi:transposase